MVIRKLSSRALGMPKLRCLKFVRNCFMLFGNCNHLEHLLQSIGQWNQHIIISVKFYLIWLFSAQNYSALFNGIHYEHWGPCSELGLFSGYSLNIEKSLLAWVFFRTQNSCLLSSWTAAASFQSVWFPLMWLLVTLFFGINAKVHHDLCLLLVLFLVFSSID